MKLRRTLALSTAFLALAGIAGIGCNTLLGNEEGTLRVSADGGAPTASGPIEAGAPPTCDTSAGNKVCFGLCVMIDQVSTGCGDPGSCEACDPKNAEGIVCQGGKTTLECAYGSCAPGYESCDGIPSNGCEASLNRPETCGGCGTACDPDGGAPLCAPAGSGYACTDTCPSRTTKCGNACVDVSKSVEHCGGCGTTCARDKATASCENGVCRYTCKPGTHDCSGVCVSDNDPATCGKESCNTPCPSGNHQVSTCNAGSCGTECESGWSDCLTSLVDDGCETQGNSCPDCGGAVCLPGHTCCSGRCVDSRVPCAGPAPY